MLSLSQKESILRKKGVSTPPFPKHPVFHRFHWDGDPLVIPMDEDVKRELKAAVARWQTEIAVLYEEHIRRPVEATFRAVKHNANGGSRSTDQG